MRLSFFSQGITVFSYIKMRLEVQRGSNKITLAHSITSLVLLFQIEALQVLFEHVPSDLTVLPMFIRLATLTR